MNMIPLCVPQIEGNEWKYIKDCLDTNWVSSVGSYVDRFEREFAAYLDTASACVTINGTAALELALRVLEIGAGDEVIVSSLTFIAPVNAIRYVGAVPVFADVCRDTFVMDAERVESLITPKTKAIIPVHIYGHPCDMDKIMEIAAAYKLFVIEDATESLGSLYKGKHTGTLGDIGCFSFNGNKMITTGGGGMLVSNNPEYSVRAKFLSNQSKLACDVPGAFYHEETGYNYRMSNITAAMGCAQLEKLPEYVERKAAHAALYNKLLDGRKGITLPVQKYGCLNCNWLYSVVIENGYTMSRNELIMYLRKNGVDTRPFFYPAHLMLHFKECRKGDMKNTLELWDEGINLPSSVGLTDTEIERVCGLV